MTMKPGDKRVFILDTVDHAHGWPGPWGLGVEDATPISLFLEGTGELCYFIQNGHKPESGEMVILRYVGEVRSGYASIHLYEYHPEDQGA